jgi:leader peptidase (prepilin peptidase)/N-methyltransferase
MTAAQIVAVWALIGGVTGAALVPVARRTMLTARPVTSTLAVSIALTAAAWGLLAWRQPAWPELVVYSAFAALAVPLALVDSFERRLPTPLVHALYVALIVASAGVGLMDGDAGRMLRAAFGMAGSLLIYLVIAMAFPGDLGAGDVRLAGAIGWVLAWHSWPTLLTGAVIGAAAGAVLGVAFMMARGALRGVRLPAGPTMVFGALSALVLAT